MADRKPLLDVKANGLVARMRPALIEQAKMAAPLVINLISINSRLIVEMAN